MAEVRLQQVCKRFGSVAAIRDLDLTIHGGELVVLLGPSGAGKTTTLRLIAGLERVESGNIWIQGRDMTESQPSERDVAFVFQQYSLYPHLTVRENLAFPLRSPLAHLDKGAIHKRVDEVAQLVRIQHKLENRATALSGGEMQRVAIGRALVRQPNIYLMDEPLSSLDAKLRAELRVELKHIQRNLGATILYVTHDQVEAMTLADRIGVLREGRLVQIGTPKEIFEYPCNTYVAERLGQPTINLIALTPELREGAPDSATTLGLRTDHVRLNPWTEATAARRKATVRKIEYLGDQTYLHLDWGGTALTFLADPGSSLAEGDAVALEWEQPLYFDQNHHRIS
jgi:multiple sugar transport system ATP-binding protein